MSDSPDQKDLPEIVQQYIMRLARRVSNRHMRQDVLAELTEHFTDALADIPQGSNRDELAGSLIADFGETKLLAKLIKRAKKRCRPLWAKFIIRTCQTLIVLMLVFAGYTYWFVTGEPTISVDLPAKLNELARPVADESLNAAPHYLKAIELYVPDDDSEAAVRDSRKNPGSALTPEQRLALTKWLNENRPTIEELRLGAAKPYCWFEYKVISNPNDSPSMATSVELPPLSDLRRIGFALCWRMQLASEEGGWDSVAADLKTAKTLGRHLMGCPTIIEQLVGLAIDDLAHTQLINILRDHNLPREALDKLSATLVGAFPSGYPIINMDGEALCHTDAIQWLFTDNGSGDGHIIPSSAVDLLVQGGRRTSTLYHLLPEPFDAPPKFVLRSLIHPSRRKTVRLFEQWGRLVDKYSSATPYQNHFSDYSMDAWYRRAVEENPRNLIFKMLTPALERAIWISYVGKAHHDATQTVVALMRYNAEHGQFPESLDQLVSQYLKAVPQDPFGPGLLTYKRQGDDFILYSWGLNFEDNGGQHNPDVFRIKNAKGDYVFWTLELARKSE